MKKYWLLLICFVGVQWTYAQSTININPGASISIGNGAAVHAGYRDGTLTSNGTFNARSITFDPVATSATSVTPSSFSANWNVSSGANGYKLDVSTVSNFTSFVTGYQNLDVGNVNTFLVSSNLSAGSTYYYRVRAYDIDGITGYSNVITIVTAPAAPVASAATNISDVSLTANWSSCAGATGYYLDVSTDPAFNSGTFITGFENKNVGNVTTASVNGLTGNTNYHYRIRAYNSYGTSTNSNSITTLTAPVIPTATAATPIAQTSFSATWDASAGATGYRLDVSTTAAFTTGTFVSGYNNLNVGNVVTYSVNTNLTAGTIYYYRLRAYNANGTSGNSNAINLITIPPNPVTTAASNILSTSFVANWNVSTGAAKYYLDVSTDAAFGDGTFVTGYENLDVNNVTTFSVNTNLAGGTTYYYRVRANNSGGTSGNSGSITVLTNPPAPVAVSAGNIAQTSFSANWNASTSATKYFLDVSIDAGFGAGTFVTGYQNLDVNNVTTFSVNTNITTGMIYYYRIRSFNSTGTSDNSNIITILTTPPNPISLSATNVNGVSFNANWNSSTSATGYIIDVSTDAGFSSGSFVTGFEDYNAGSVTTIPVTGLTVNTTYYYRIRAYNASGNGGNSGTITVLTAPAAPVAIAGSNSALHSFSANWNADAGATGYLLDVSTDMNFTAGFFVTGYNGRNVGNVITYSVNANLNYGTTYYYRVRAYSANGTSAYSNGITYGTLPTNPFASSASSITSSGFNANWNSATGATGYRLDVSTVPDFASRLALYDNLDIGNVVTYSITGLNSNTIYYYRVRPYNNYGTGGNSGVISLTTVPFAPVTIAASLIQTTNFTANWNSVAGVSGYFMDVSTASDFSSFVTGFNSIDAGNVTSYIITGLSSGVNYYYRVRAYNAGGTSINSNSQTVLTLSSAPVAISATSITAVSFNANWNSVTSATGYRLDVSTLPDFSIFVGSFNNFDVNNVSTYSVTGLTAGNTYYYRVRSYNSTGTNGNSNSITVKTIPPAPVQLPATAAAYSSFNANWNSSNGADGYYLDVATDNGFGSYVAGFNNKNIGNVTTYSVTGLSSSTNYYYRIRTYNSGGTSGNSGSTTVSTNDNLVSIPAVNPASSITSSSFSANWNPVSGATKYFLDVSSVSNFTTFVTAWENVDVGNVVTYSVNTNLTAGNSYYYRVRAFNVSGTSGNSNTVLVKMIPPAPVEQPALSIAATNFDANWNASNGATGYYVDVAEDNLFSTFVAGFNNRDVGNVTTYTVTGLTGSTPYYYRIRAYNTGGTSGNSNTINSTTLAGGTVIATAATSVSGISFIANWNAYATSAGYKLSVATTSNFAAGTFVAGYQDLDVGNVTNYSVTGLSAGTNYYYRVNAYNSVPADIGTSGTINVITLPGAPAAASASSINEISFAANWSSSISATGYYLDVATDIGFTNYVTGFNNKYVNNVLTYTVTGLSGGTAYYYHVRAKNGSGVGSSSTPITVITLPLSPQATYATALTNNSFNANWNSSAGADGYILDVSTVSNFSSFVGIYNSLDVGDVVSSSVSGLNGGTIYYYRIRAYNVSGTSDNSETVSALTLPLAPVPASASSILTTSFEANWNSSVGATKYYLDVATTPGFTGGTYVTGFQNLDAGNSLSYTISGLTGGTNYYYRVRAFNSSGTSDNSVNTNVLTLPAPPVILAATNIESVSFSANWNSSLNAAKYYLDVATTSNFTAGTYAAGFQNFDVGNVTTYSVTGLTNGNNYYYRVRAYNSSGTGNNSETSSVITAPIEPVATSASSPGETNFIANWNSSAGADGYKLDVSTVSNFISYVPGFNNKDVGSVATYPVAGLTGGTSYYFRVRSYIGGRTSGNSNTINALTLPPAPVAAAPSLITETSFTANWNTATSAVKYFLEVSPNSDFASYVTGYNLLDVGNVINYPVTGLSANTIYYYRVSANNSAGTGAVSNIKTILTTPVAPAAIAATSITNASFIANWNTSTGATKYFLDVSTVSNFVSFVGIYNNKDVGNVTSSIIIGLSGSTTYYYRLRAYNASGSSLSSGAVNLTTMADPSGVPVASAATANTETSFAANWNSVAGATGYRLDVSTDWNFDTGSFVTNFNDKDAGNVTTYSVTGLAAGTTYYYRVRSYNLSGTSSNSGIITTKTISAAPSATAATTITSVSFISNWNASTGADGYYLDVSTDSGFSNFVTGFNNRNVAGVTTFSITGLAGGTIYFYRVRAYNGTGTSINSNQINVITIPSAVTANAATLFTETSFSANWNPALGASGYRLDVSSDAGFTAESFIAGFEDKDVSNISTYSVAGLPAGTNYYYRVRAYNGSGTGANSNNITALTVSTIPVTSAATSVAGTSFSANWNSVNGAVKYYLDISADSGFGAGYYVPGYQNKDVGNITTLIIPGLSTNTNYYYRVRSNNSSGTSDNSNIIAVLTSPPPPTAAAATSQNENNFIANWNSATGATGYRLDVSTDIGFGAGTFEPNYENADVGNVVSYKVDNIISETTHYYRVRAYNNGGASSNSEAIKVLGIPCANSATAIALTSFSANWGTVNGVTGYKLDVATDFNFNAGSFVAGFNNKDVGNVTSFPVSGLMPNVTYYYRVRTYDLNGSSGNSNTVLVKNVPAAPTALAAANIQQISFTAKWQSAAGGATGYIIDVAYDAGFTAFATGLNNKVVYDVLSLPISDLLAGSAYFYRIRAYNSLGPSENSNTIKVELIPAEPKALAAAIITQTSFIANWNASEGAGGYSLDVSTDSNFTIEKYVTGFYNKDVYNRTSFSVNVNIKKATSYYYRIRAYNISGKSYYSNIIRVNTSPNIKPVLSALETDSLSYSEGNSPIQITNSIIASDLDDTELSGAVIKIAANYQSGEDVLSFQNQNGITGSWSSGTGEMILTGKSSVSNYQSAIRNIAYVNISIKPGNKIRTVSFVIKDSVSSSDVVQRNIKVISINTPPVLAGIETAPLNYNIKQAELQITNSIVVTDVDDESEGCAVIQVSENYFENEDSLACSNISGGTSTWDRSSGKLVLSCKVSASMYQNMMCSIKYINYSMRPTVKDRTISFTFNDGKENSNTVYRKVNISSVNAAPVLTGVEKNKLIFKVNSSPLFISDSLLITDVDNIDLFGGEVKITSGFKPDEDELLYTGNGKITCTYNRVTGVLEFKGCDKISCYRDAFKSVQYSNTHGSEAIKSLKTVEFKVWDGMDFSLPAIRTIDVDGIISGVEKFSDEIPKEYVLFQNYPNPFNPSTTLRYGLPKNSEVKVVIYNIIGEEIAVLFNGFQNAGYYIIDFNANKLASGIYFYRIISGDPSQGSGHSFIQTKKMILIK